MDLLLLALFLVFGVALLDIVVKLIVLIVGYVMAVKEPSYFKLALEGWGPTRHRDDWVGLVVSIGASAVLGVLFFYGLKLRRFLLSRLIDAGFESFISKRYLISRESGSLVSLITVVSVLGVSVGVMALVVVISVMNGFDSIFLDRIMGVFGHVEVRADYFDPDAEFSEAQAEQIMKLAESTPGIVAASPLIRRETFFQVQVSASQKQHGIRIYGIDPTRENKVTNLMASVIETSPGVPGQAVPGRNEIVVGSELARQAGIVVGDTIHIFGKTVVTARGPTPKWIPLKVVGIMETGLHDVDSFFAYTNIETAQSLYLTSGKIPVVHMKVKDAYEATRIAEQLAGQLPRNSYLITWESFNREFFAALKTEKIAMFIILLMIVLVASLNIVGTLVMVVTQKTREIGILKSMGATKAMILRVFLFHGAFIGLVGTSLGTAFGLWLCRFVDKDIHKIFQLPGAVYGLDRLPVLVDFTTIASICICSFLICLIAGLIPALQAARLNPVEALRYS
ncbi:MAG: lipoprotein-releasing system permease protein [Candidatus Sumerlaeota bacterium]|nr:lipoprotein-releasing system permease protein [Candidatus Sumerlaeota bacterium]